MKAAYIINKCFSIFISQNVFPDASKSCGPYKPNVKLRKPKNLKGNFDPSSHDTIGNCYSYDIFEKIIIWLDNPSLDCKCKCVFLNADMDLSRVPKSLVLICITKMKHDKWTECLEDIFENHCLIQLIVEYDLSVTFLP